MEKMSLLQSFAVDKSGRIKSVEEVERGLACECVCPTCGEAVLARQGEVREWHFAHASGTECDGAAEGALHLAAKQLILDTLGMELPEFVESTSVTLPDGRKGDGEARKEAFWIDFEQAEEEKSFGMVRPDVVATNGDMTLFIEIAVTHYVDEQKQQLLEQLGYPTIEVDIGGVEWVQWDWDLLREVVIENTKHKKWIVPIEDEALKFKSHETALKAALDKAVVDTSSSHYPKPVRTRYRVGGRIVDVVERPFGLAVWSPYDPVVNGMIKPLFQMLGGRWQPRFKNWLLPLEAKEHLMSELNKLSGLPPERMD